jgi:hypothetical protein
MSPNGPLRKDATRQSSTNSTNIRLYFLGRQFGVKACRKRIKNSSSRRHRGLMRIIKRDFAHGLCRYQSWDSGANTVVNHVLPAKAGIQMPGTWIPAYAGRTSSAEVKICGDGVKSRLLYGAEGLMQKLKQGLPLLLGRLIDLKPVPDPRLGENVARTRRLGFELPAQVTDMHLQQMRLVLIDAPPHLS